MVSGLIGCLRRRDLYPMLAIGFFGDLDFDWACGGSVGGIVALRGLHCRSFRKSAKFYRVLVNIRST